MNFDPITRRLFTNEGEYLKTLQCPHHMRWEELEAGDRISRPCSRCEHQIIDATAIPEVDLVELLRKDPGTCVKIDFDHPAIRITYTPNGHV